MVRQLLTPFFPLDPLTVRRRGVANLAQFTGQSTANVIATQLGSYAYALWISAAIALFSFLCAASVVVLDRFLRARYDVTDQTNGRRHTGTRKNVFRLRAVQRLPLTYWIVVLFSVFENAGVQSFISISTQFAQQRLKKGAVIGGWVSSFYLLLPACLTPFLGIYIDAFGQRIGLLFISGLTFLLSMLLLKFSHSVPSFVAAYVFYALSQTVTPAPQVEIIRTIIPDPQDYATGFAIKKSVVQASIVIITTAAGQLQDESPTDSLDPAVSLWLAYAFISVAVSGALLLVAYLAPALLPAARLSQVSPRALPAEVERLARMTGLTLGGAREECSRDGEKEESGGERDGEEADETKEKERQLKAPDARLRWARWACLAGGAAIIVVGWVMFGLGVEWGVRLNVIAGTVGT
ncbi:hypothetical protein AcV5_010283 [Taiwanofungus camphoratus]|nr:hypothetical protein AcV5_010283 [Antrodia cinnamomea]